MAFSKRDLPRFAFLIEFPIIQIENTQVKCEMCVILHIIVLLKDMKKTKNRINNIGGAAGFVVFFLFFYATGCV